MNSTLPNGAQMVFHYSCIDNFKAMQNQYFSSISILHIVN